MLKTLLTTALGLTAAATLTVEAEGCSYRDVNYASEPYMAEFVRRAHYIDLVTVRGIALLPDEDQRFYERPETHRYEFEVVDSLRGGASGRFSYLAGAPYPESEPLACIGVDDVVQRSRTLPCVIYDRVQGLREAGRRTADSGRQQWALFNAIHPSYQDGMGGVFDPRVGTSCAFAQSFEQGADYLVFRDANGEIIRSLGLNLQMITQADDRWLSAVQYFIEYPEADWLPAQAAQDVLLRFNRVAQVRMDICPDLDAEYPPDLSARAATVERLISGPNDRFVPTSYIEYERDRELLELDDCISGSRYLFVAQRNTVPRASRMPFIPPLPIRYGMVDLSGIPSQHAIEPSQVPLADVIAWLSEAPETESPQ